ncbi:MAG: hypothetical protein JWQ49_2183, partial [Edaphobacter sp.]|nr:hypothetical protein [Edaphobacter sp.]
KLNNHNRAMRGEKLTSQLVPFSSATLVYFPAALDTCLCANLRLEIL